MSATARRPTADDLRRAEAAHYRLQSLLYLPHCRDLRLASGGGATLFSAEVAEPEWNHAAQIAVGVGELPELLAAVAEHYLALGRPATLAVSPWTRPADLGERLAGRGFEPTFRHAWLVHRLPADDPPPWPAPVPEIEIAVVEDEATMAAFVDVFVEVYSRALDADGSDPGADDASPLAPGYGRLLWRSFREPTTDGQGEVIHHLARHQGRAVGVATTLHGGGIAGLYDLAVLPAHRHLGIGAMMTAHRLAAAHARGARLAFLQTERRQVERWQRRHGFVPGFVTVGWTAPS